MDMGRTIGFDQHAEAVRGVVAAKGLCASEGCADRALDDFWKRMHPLASEMAAHGYDSVQFFRAEHPRLSPMEMVFTALSESEEFSCLWLNFFGNECLYFLVQRTSCFRHPKVIHVWS